MIAPLHYLFDDFEAETDLGQKIFETIAAPDNTYYRYYFGPKASKSQCIRQNPMSANRQRRTSPVC
jgi:hypothetical protein